MKKQRNNSTRAWALHVALSIALLSISAVLLASSFKATPATSGLSAPITPVAAGDKDLTIAGAGSAGSLSPGDVPFTFDNTGSLNTERSEHTATLLPNDAYPNSYSHSETYTDGHVYSDTYSHSHGYGYVDAYADGDGNCYAHCNGASDSNSNSNGNAGCNANRDTDGNANCDTNGDSGAEKQTDAQAAPDAEDSLAAAGERSARWFTFRKARFSLNGRGEFILSRAFA
jgi:hypothetical protein